MDTLAKLLLTLTVWMNMILVVSKRQKRGVNCHSKGDNCCQNDNNTVELSQKRLSLLIILFRQARSCRVRKLLPEVESVQCFRFDDSLIPLKGSESGWDMGSLKAFSLPKMSRILEFMSIGWY